MVAWAVAAMPQGLRKRASGHERRARDGQFKESGLSACGILDCKPDSRRRTRLTRLSQYVTAFHLARGPSQFACDGGIVPAMLPGIRFLLAAILLSISIVVFGLGAAALLRAAHEDFASNPSWRLTPETRLAQQSDMPTLALLRVDTPAPADVPDSVAPETNATAPAAVSGEQVATVSPAPETAVAPMTAPPAPDAIKTEAPPALPSPSSEPSPATAASEAAPAADQPNKPDATPETKMAATEPSDTPSKTSEAAPVTPDPVKPDVASSESARPEAAKPEASSTVAAKPEQANASPPPEAAPTMVAKLDAPAAKIEEPSPTKAEARKAAERADEKAKARAEKKAKARRRLAAQRARTPRQSATQRTADPFGQLQPARTP
jgi:hypothetical protein